MAGSRPPGSGRAARANTRLREPLEVDDHLPRGHDVGIPGIEVEEVDSPFLPRVAVLSPEGGGTANAGAGHAPVSVQLAFRSFFLPAPTENDTLSLHDALHTASS